MANLREKLPKSHENSTDFDTLIYFIFKLYSRCPFKYNDS